MMDLSKIDFVPMKAVGNFDNIYIVRYTKKMPGSLDELVINFTLNQLENE